MPIIPDLPTNTSAQYNPVAPSPAAAMAPGRGLIQAGNSMIQAAGITGDLAETMERREAARIRNTARIRMQEAYSNHELFRAENRDEHAWEDNIKREAAKARADIFKQSPDMNPMLKEELEESFSGWENEAVNGTKISALAYRTAKGRTVTTELGNSYRKAGKFQDARVTLDEAEAAGLFTPEELEADREDIDFEEREFSKREIATKYELGAEDDPVSALKVLSAKGEEGFLNEPEMEDGIRFRLIKHAERSLARKQDEEFTIFKNAIDRGEVHQAELERHPLFLGDAEKKSLAAYLKRHTPPTEAEDREAWGEVQKVRDAYNAAKSRTMDEVDFRNAHRAARAKILELVPAGYSGPLLETLQRFSPARVYDMKADAPPSRDDIKKDLSLEVRSTMGAAFDAGFFGTVTDDTPPMQREAAARKRRDLERKALDWIAAEENPTPEAARAYADSLISTDRVKATVNELQSFVPGSGQRFRPAPMAPLPGMEPGTGQASDAILPARQQLESFINPKP